MLVHIPKHKADLAITQASKYPKLEVIGLFVIHTKTLAVDYKKMYNIAKNPSNSAEVSAVDIVETIISKNMVPIALFHSHPSGAEIPSQGDLDYFPRSYLDWGFIWTKSAAPDIFTQYSWDGKVSIVRTAELFIEVQA